MTLLDRVELERPFGPGGARREAPRVAIVIPAWNEAAVLERTLDRLLALEYPADRLRVYVVDDASTDATPEKVAAKAAAAPGRIFHLDF